MNKPWTSDDIAPQAGRRAIVTGANSGIGYYTAATLARHGAEVVLACRDEQRGTRALAGLRAEVPEARVRLAQIDLASLASVRAFAERELASCEPLDLLINNAGVMAPTRRIETAEGFELQLGTNVLGHFALTCLLLPALEMAAVRSPERPRVVTVASIAHKRGRLDFDDLQAMRHYKPMVAYRQSKLANLMLAFELDRRLRAARSGVMSVAAHPGVASTNLFRAGEHSVTGRAARAVLSGFIRAVMNSDVAGALPTLYAATAPDVVDGGYYGPLGMFETRGERVGPASVASQARSEADAQRLWQTCEALTGTLYG
ncbi:oxidoreductase [Paraburkholderia rhizosphaerae]|uniref:NAD(P)-dependent dehydrogenase (Short-subunit alcohol dehydrogenase family) n=1 Tax=Paraburkholderia rhizosphaerae TaxID=480658 RepID=A0A4V3HE12_9BURK|nr:oxidoreductase [Paraburkholderia rhizosphaerae]TDY43295.1 NAD(P)-dependent dehydrogenase (short-subunit alcohol dehydrogenase family) [Paraburkholderia rhizosphaerae]